MPGILIIRPVASSAAKAAKSTAAKNAAVSAGRAEKGRDDPRRPGQGRAPASTAISRPRGLLKAPPLRRNGPVAPPAAPLSAHHLQQQQNVSSTKGQQQHGGACGNVITSTKQVMAPLVEDAGAAAKRQYHGVEILQRVGGAQYSGSSSGSEHEPNSVCLAEMVYDYIEDDVVVERSKCGRARCNCGLGCSGEEVSPAQDADDSSVGVGEISEVLIGLVSDLGPTERSILSTVTLALRSVSGDETESGYGEENRKLAGRSETRRGVMSTLRSSGHNAAVCKSRWEHVGAFPPGNYEYVDVIMEGSGHCGIGKEERIIVDLDFQAQFEIARPTGRYSALLQSLPAIYVGKSDRLQQIVNIMCNAVKRSLKKHGLQLPPWRKPEYMRAKWFSGYRRTTNSASYFSPVEPPNKKHAGWGSNFTTMEPDKSHINEVDLKMALGHCAGEKTRIGMRAGDQPEGKVRGGNLLRFLQLGKIKSQDSDPTEWEPPLVIPRTSTHQGGKMGGLLSILTESRLKEMGTKSEQPLEQENIAPLQGHQAPISLKQMVLAR